MNVNLSAAILTGQTAMMTLPEYNVSKLALAD
jgi:hypothetical protein